MRVWCVRVWCGVVCEGVVCEGVFPYSVPNNFIITDSYAYIICIHIQHQI